MLNGFPICNVCSCGRLISLQKLSQWCIPIQTLIFVVSSQTPVTYQPISRTRESPVSKQLISAVSVTTTSRPPADDRAWERPALSSHPTKQLAKVPNDERRILGPGEDGSLMVWRENVFRVTPRGSSERTPDDFSSSTSLITPFDWVFTVLSVRYVPRWWAAATLGAIRAQVAGGKCQALSNHVCALLLYCVSTASCLTVRKLSGNINYITPQPQIWQ